MSSRRLLNAQPDIIDEVDLGTFDSEAAEDPQVTRYFAARQRSPQEASRLRRLALVGLLLGSVVVANVLPQQARPANTARASRPNTILVPHQRPATQADIQHGALTLAKSVLTAYDEGQRPGASFGKDAQFSVTPLVDAPGYVLVSEQVNVTDVIPDGGRAVGGMYEISVITVPLKGGGFSLEDVRGVMVGEVVMEAGTDGGPSPYFVNFEQTENGWTVNGDVAEGSLANDAFFNAPGDSLGQDYFSTMSTLGTPAVPELGTQDLQTLVEQGQVVVQRAQAGAPTELVPLPGSAALREVNATPGLIDLLGN